jgi:two-component system CheB/CheR fusion protein
MSVSESELMALALDQARAHAIILLDPQGVIVGWKGGAEHTLGYRADEIVGKALSTIFIEEDIANGAPQLEMEMAAKSGEANDDRWQLRKDGGKIWVNGAMTPLRNAAGELVGFVKILRNRTDSKEQVLTLEKQIAALHERDHRKNVFVTTLAHDLRNPLGALKIGIMLIKTTVPSEGGGKSISRADAAETLEMMERETRFVEQMISNMLESARSAAGKIELHLTKVALQTIVQSVAETCAPESGVTLQVLMPEAPVYIYADATRMRQVVGNLVDNAIKHTRGRGNIWIKVMVDGNSVLLKVQDNGKGISPEFLPHIFELFTQAESGANATSGIGLGLSLVKDIVTLHGGTVQAMSDGVGKGSSFTVRIPMAEPYGGV